jgi:hypothetical protein
VEGQTTQWPKEKGQKDKQRPTKHTHKTKDQPLKSNSDWKVCKSFPEDTCMDDQVVPVVDLWPKP